SRFCSRMRAKSRWRYPDHRPLLSAWPRAPRAGWERGFFSSLLLSVGALVSVGAFALSGVLAAAQDAAPAGQRTDGQIEMDVVHALDASQALKNDLITAATIQAEVTLSGTVSSDASRNLAESIVKGVPGVTGVHNNLKVGNPAN